MTGIALAGEVRYDCLRFVEQGLTSDPQMEELRYGTEAKKNKIGALKSEVILPTFYVSMMVGPAPGLKEYNDYYFNQSGDTLGVEKGEKYDFSRMGPFWGVEAKFIQPLNLGQYRTGKLALEADLQQKTFEIENSTLKKEVEHFLPSADRTAVLEGQERRALPGFHRFLIRIPSADDA